MQSTLSIFFEDSFDLDELFFVWFCVLDKESAPLGGVVVEVVCEKFLTGCYKQGTGQTCACVARHFASLAS
jgi:hypothetical protein